MDAGFGSWLLGMSLGGSAPGGLLGMAGGTFIAPILALFGGVDLTRRSARASAPIPTGKRYWSEPLPLHPALAEVPLERAPPGLRWSGLPNAFVQPPQEGV
jgi:hypothetical protein